MMCRNAIRSSLLLLAGAALTLTIGCTMEPKYQQPTPPVAQQWPEGPAYPAAPAADATFDASALDWQTFFADEHLRQLIALALENNRDLRMAALNVQRARLIHGIAKAELLPTVSAGAGADKQSLPGDLSSGDRNESSTYSVNLGITAWEIDFFGRIRSLAKASLQEYLATDEARRGVQILLVSAIANTYLTLAADQENLGLAQTTLQAQQDTLELVKRRSEHGVAPELDIYRAQTQVDTARLAVIQYTRRIAQDRNALTLLAGAEISANLLPVTLDQTVVTHDLPVGVPSQVLLRRPDVIAAEHRLLEAYANIGAARAAFFPRISLTAALGTASAELSNLFSAGQGFWRFNAQATMPIFDQRVWQAAKVSETDRQLALTQYERAVQVSFREVADVLAIRGTVDEQLAAQQSLVESVAQTHELAQARYLKGVDSYLGVLDAQRSLYAAQQQLVSVRLAKLSNQVQLYAALGGGWQPAATESPAAPQP